MKRMLGTVAVFAIAVFLVFTAENVFAGGGSQGAASTEGRSGSGNTIDMLLWWSTNPEQIETLVKQYEASRPGVKVNLSFMVGSGEQENLEPRIAANNMPDLTSGGASVYMYELADRGLLGDVSETEAWKKLSPGMQAAWTSPKGVKFGVPYGVAYMYVYYNKELFEKAGISSPPQSWDEWMEVCQKLKNAGITPIALPGLSANNIGHNVFSGACTGIVSVADPAISTVSNLAYKNYNFDNPLFRKVFQRARDWATSGFVIDGFMSYDYDACVRAFANQEVAMCIEGSWSVANYLNDAEFDFTPLTFIPPYNDRGTPLYGSGCSETGFVIGGTPTVNRELALDIINFMAYEKFAERQQMTGVVPPFAISDIKGEINLHPESARTSNDIASRATMGPLMFTVMLPDVYNRATVLTQEVMMGTTTPDEAVKILNQLQSSYF